MKRIVVLFAAAALITVAGCKLLTDPKVQFTREGTATPAQSECSKQCDREYQAALAAAKAEHKRIMDEVCWPLPWVLEKPCRQEEHARYRQAKLAIYEARKQCKRKCWYNEGSGSGGH